MKRRDFLTATAAAAGATLASPSLASAAAASGQKDLIELRLYHFASAEKLQAFDAFLAGAAVPALNRLGVKPVGVFSLSKDDNPDLKPEHDHPLLFVVMAHKSMQSVVGLIEQLARDATFTGEGSAILEAPKTEPAYTRFESSLLLGFDEAPRVEVVSRAPSRLAQLRIYESHNDERALSKIAMFNDGGEIAIFRKCGMPPVFFGQALIGSRLPNLTYLLAFDDAEAQKQAWAAFGADPGWKALRSDPTYADTVSNITNLILRPTPSSQL
jgi:hypothetical protein